MTILSKEDARKLLALVDEAMQRFEETKSPAGSPSYDDLMNLHVKLTLIYKERKE